MVWWDDVSITETPTIHLLHRKYLPFSIREAGRKSVLSEGKDFEPVRDSKLGSVVDQKKYGKRY